jgi:uncharacterized protein YjdB
MRTRFCLLVVGVCLASIVNACGTGPDVGSVQLQPVADTVAVGDSIVLTAVVRSSDGNLLDAHVSWSSSQSGVATVSSGGGVHGFAA